MGMRVDAARHDKAALGVERTVAFQSLADRLDGLAVDQHVGLVGAVRGDDRSAFDDERHVPTLLNNAIPDANSRPPPQKPSPRIGRRKTPVSRRAVRGEGSGHDTISAFSSTACISTLAPAVAQSGLMSSLSLWLIPSTQGVNTIDVGAARAR